MLAFSGDFFMTDWQSNFEGAAAAWAIAVGCDAAAVQLDQTSDKGQAQAESALRTVWRTLSLRKQLKDLGQESGFYSDTVIFDGNLDFRVTGCNSQGNPPP
nr:hypothetical protein [Massilia putida]